MASENEKETAKAFLFVFSSPMFNFRRVFFESTVFNKKVHVNFMCAGEITQTFYFSVVTFARDCLRSDVTHVMTQLLGKNSGNSAKI